MLTYSIGDCMVRTQVYLTEEQHKTLTHLAKVRNQPMAELVRELLAKGLHENVGKDISGKTAMKNLFKIRATGGPTDLSTNLDHYLYGGPKKQVS